MMIMEVYIIIAIVVVAITAIIHSKRKKKSKKEGADVPQGLQVFDGKGNTVIDTSDNLCRILGSQPLSGSNGSITVDIGDTSCKLWACYFSSSSSSTLVPLKVVINGNKITWTYEGTPSSTNGVVTTWTKAGVLLYGSY